MINLRTNLRTQLLFIFDILYIKYHSRKIFQFCSFYAKKLQNAISAEFLTKFPKRALGHTITHAQLDDQNFLKNK